MSSAAALWDSFDLQLDEFERAWQSADTPPSPDPLIRLVLAHEAADARRQRLTDLLELDLEYRWRLHLQSRTGKEGVTPPRERSPRLEEYLVRWPELQEMDGLLDDLIAADYRIRSLLGEAPSPDSYVARFPDRSDVIRARLGNVDSELACEAPAHRVEIQAARSERTKFERADLANVLRELQLAEPSRIDELESMLRAGELPDPDALASFLRDRLGLTPLQVEFLLEGNGHSLVLGPYVLLDRLGEGWSSQVFRARHRRLDRLAALKVIRKEHLHRVDPEIVQRFLKEMEAVGKLSHPHIVHAYDAGPVGSTLFIALEYIEGIDLHRLVMRHGPLPVAEACAYVREAALALEHARQVGLVHRDVKPSNLMLAMPSGATNAAPEGRGATARVSGAAGGCPSIKLLDLGLAKLPLSGSARSSTALTRIGTLMGTPDYMAPEQADDPRRADVRADLYSLGCTLFFLLTGQPPFPGGTFAHKLKRHQSEPPPPVRRYRDDVPDGLAHLIQVLLAKKPEDRLQTPVELARRLTPYCEGGTDRGGRWRVWATAAVLALLLVCAAVGAMLGGRQAPFQRSVDDGKAELSWTAEPPPRIESSAAYEWRLANEHGPLAELTVVLGDSRLRHWREARGVAWVGEGRTLVTTGLDHVICWWDARSGRRLASWKSPGGAIRALAAHPRTGLLVVGDDSGAIHLFPPGQFAPAGRLADATSAVVALAVSPVDAVIAAALRDAKDVHLWDAETGEHLPALAGHTKPVHAIAFGNDGDTLISAAGDGTARSWSIEQRKSLHVWSVPKSSCVAVACSPREDVAALAFKDGPLLLVDSVTGKELRTLSPRCNITALTFQHDGQVVSAGCLDGALRSWNVDGRAEPGISAHIREIGALAYRADDQVLATAGDDGQIRLWNPVQRVPWGPSEHQAAPILSVATHPNNGTLAVGSADGLIHLVDAQRGRIVHRVGQHRGPTFALAFHPDGSPLASGGGDRVVRLWDLEHSHPPRIFGEPRRAVGALAFAQQGRQLAASSSDGLVYLWDTHSGRLRRELRAMPTGLPPLAAQSSWSWFAFAPRDAHLHLARADGDLEMRSIRGPRSDVLAVAFHPEGRWVITSSRDRRLRIWDVETGKLVPELRPQTLAEPLRNLDFLPDGSLLAGAGLDGAAHLVDLTRPERPIRSLQMGPSAGKIVQVVCLPGSRRLACVNGNGTVYLLDLDRQTEREDRLGWVNGVEIVAPSK